MKNDPNWGGEHGRRAWDEEALKSVSKILETEAMAITPDGQTLVSASGDHTLKVWDLASGQCLATFSADAPVVACAVTPDGNGVVAGDASGGVHFLRLEGVESRRR